jgi:hypothetical protein
LNNKSSQYIFWLKLSFISWNLITQKPESMKTNKNPTGGAGPPPTTPWSCLECHRKKLPKIVNAMTNNDLLKIPEIDGLDDREKVEIVKNYWIARNRTKQAEKRQGVDFGGR